MKRLLLVLILGTLGLQIQAQNQPGLDPNIPKTPKNNFTKYNSATFGAQGGKSVQDRAASVILYNFNQFSITNRLFVSTYTEYYKDWNNLFFSNYFNGQAFVNYKLPHLINVGMGYRFHQNFEMSQQQNFLQFKVEKTFTW